MTAAQELALWEAALTGFLQAGGVQSYTTGDGRTVTRANVDSIIKRVDQLRADVARGTSSGFSVADFRRDY